MTAFGDPALLPRLGRMLRGLRTAHGIGQPQLAARLGEGWSQSRVSRTESGGIKKPPSLLDVDRWCLAVEATPQQRQAVMEVAERLVLGPTSWDEAGSDEDLIAQTKAAEAKASTISVYQPVTLPGLLQTAAYGRRIITAGPNGEPPHIDRLIVGRLDRQRILSDDSKRFRFIVTEAALRWAVGPADEHVEQLDRIIEVMTRENVAIGVLPMRPPLVWRTGGFVLFEDIAGGDPPLVHVELLTRPVNVLEPDQVGDYQVAFGNLMNASLWQDEARALVLTIRRAGL